MTEIAPYAERPKTARTLQSAVDEIVGLTRAAGTVPVQTAIPGVVMVKGDIPARQLAAVYQPMIGFTVQGSKTLSVGGREVLLKGPCYYVIPTHMPATGRVRPGPGGRPYLSLGLFIRPEAIQELLRALPFRGPASPPRPLSGCAADLEFCEAWLRMLRLLRQPAAIPALAPAHEREILYRVLMGPQGWRLRQAGLERGRACRLSETVQWIRKHYDEPLDARDLAARACMAPTTFHRRFKRVTGLSPIQFQKRLRLLEARNLMAFQELTASGAAYEVGYRSPSQFAREYARFFGETPARDAALYRRGGAAAALREACADRRHRTRRRRSEARRP